MEIQIKEYMNFVKEFCSLDDEKKQYVAGIVKGMSIAKDVNQKEREKKC